MVAFTSPGKHLSTLLAEVWSTASLKALSVALAGISAAAALTILNTTPAAADSCLEAADAGGYDIFFNSNQDSAYQGFAGDDSDYYNDYFMCRGNGSGYTQVVKNNAAYVVNWSTSSVRIFYSSGYNGSFQTFGKVFSSTYAGPLNSTLKNENASGKFV